MYFNIQVTSFLENTTPHDKLGLPAHRKLNSPFVFQLQMLFALDFFLYFPFCILKRTRTIPLVRVLDNERV